MRIKIFCLVSLITFMLCCSTDYREANDKAVEKLRTQIIEEKYEEIYDHTSTISKAKISRNEFVERMKKAAQDMKEVDESMTWQKSEKTNWEDLGGNDSNFSFRTIEKNKKKVDIYIYWETPFRLCSFELSSSDTKVLPDCT